MVAPWISPSAMTKPKKSTIEKFDKQAFKAQKLMFIHIPRAGGTAASRHIFKRLPSTHIRADYFNNIKKYNDYTTFCFSRHPYSRFVSVYCYNRRDDKEKDNILHELSLAEAIEMLEENNINPQNHHGTWIKDNSRLSGHFWPQTWWINTKTEVYKSESMRIGMIVLAQKHQLSELEQRSRACTAIRMKNQRRHKKTHAKTAEHLHKLLTTDPSLKNKFFDWYGTDFEALGYKQEFNEQFFNWYTVSDHKSNWYGIERP